MLSSKRGGRPAGLSTLQHHGDRRASTNVNAAKKPFASKADLHRESRRSLNQSELATGHHQGRQGGSPKTDFGSSLLKNTKEATEARKVQLPDIIRVSKANLQTLSALDGRNKEDFIRKFKKTLYVNPEEELKYLRAVADGRRKQLSYNHKADQKLNSYQDPAHLRQLEPMNTAKQLYMKQFGSSVWNNESKLVDILMDKGSDFYDV